MPSASGEIAAMLGGLLADFLRVGRGNIAWLRVVRVVPGDLRMDGNGVDAQVLEQAVESSREVHPICARAR